MRIYAARMKVDETLRDLLRRLLHPCARRLHPFRLTTCPNLCLNTGAIADFNRREGGY